MPEPVSHEVSRTPDAHRAVRGARDGDGVGPCGVARGPGFQRPGPTLRSTPPAPEGRGHRAEIAARRRRAQRRGRPRARTGAFRLTRTRASKCDSPETLVAQGESCPKTHLRTHRRPEHCATPDVTVSEMTQYYYQQETQLFRKQPDCSRRCPVCTLGEAGANPGGRRGGGAPARARQPRLLAPPRPFHPDLTGSANARESPLGFHVCHVPRDGDRRESRGRLALTGVRDAPSSPESAGGGEAGRVPPLQAPL